MEGSEHQNPQEEASDSQPMDTDELIAGSSTAANQPAAQPSAPASASGPSSTRTRMLLACDRCRSRKSKCDRNLPSCTACLIAGVPCMTAERDRLLSTDGRHVPRGYIEDLERQVHDLEGQYRQVLLHASASHPDPPFVGQIPVSIESGPGLFLPPAARQQIQQPPTQIVPLIDDPLSFENTLFQAIKLSGSDPLRASAPNLLFGNLSPAFGDRSALAILQSMDRETVLGAVTTYFEFVHAHYPLLVRQDITSKYNLMMQPNYQAGQIRPAEELVVYLVVVVGMTVSVNLRAAPMFPQMLYRAALQTSNVFSDVESISKMQALILIVIYSLYDPCAGSSWYLLDIVVSKCLSTGLHLISSALGNGIERNAKIWAFWTLYSLDRMAGASMGRPFTIANDDVITVPVPGIREPGTSDGTGFLSGPLITYFQLLYLARRSPDAGAAHWQNELDLWRHSTKTSVNLDIHTNASNPSPKEYLNAMNNYIDLIYYQGLLLIPQLNVEFPTITPQIVDLYGTEKMYHASKMVGLSFGVHRFPLAWTAGYKAFATCMSYLLCLALIDRSNVNLPEIYHISMACINTIESVATKFEGLAPYSRFLIRAVDMMLRLYNVEGGNTSIARDPHFLYTPYSEIVPRSPNSGIPQPPDVADLQARKFRCLGRLYLTAMENIRATMFPGT
ncbi:hypothetical protein DRE_07371 [Drechslerella stenobrocha 248]|uniref:Zn(2)-C6 fungal-type domain-containing protein n=1 Tax=Drechslerella stenobrocha 248 TaxID=1043628 RepID=W7HV54_9PEZI|nr:hypothetical protein DRE_07371 [Drechslerella stenobrocha 248]